MGYTGEIEHFESMGGDCEAMVRYGPWAEPTAWRRLTESTRTPAAAKSAISLGRAGVPATLASSSRRRMPTWSCPRAVHRPA